jgi:hypothetical protein
MVHNNFVIIDEIYHWLQLMYIFLIHVVYVLYLFIMCVIYYYYELSSLLVI